MSAAAAAAADDEEGSDCSDEWGVEELPTPAILPTTKDDGRQQQHQEQAEEEEEFGDDYWNDEKTTRAVADDSGGGSSSSRIQTRDGSANSSSNNNNNNASSALDAAGFPMFLVDLTQMDPGIHSKFDRNSVSDPDAASRLRKQVEATVHDDKNKKKADLLANGTLLPCGSSVWKEALPQLRQDRPGHYLVPIFPPKGKTTTTTTTTTKK